MKNNCIYFAEGKCEERLLNALKENPQKIQSGRVKVFKPNAHEFVEYLANPTTTHSFSACMKKVENYIPVMDSDDAIIYFEDYQLTEDPVKAEIFGHKENI